MWVNRPVLGLNLMLLVEMAFVYCERPQNTYTRASLVNRREQMEAAVGREREREAERERERETMAATAMEQWWSSL